MSKTKDEAVEILPGTQEHKTREHFAKEQAAYEKRTGEKSTFELGHPTTSTPLEKGPVDRSKVKVADLKAEAESLGIDLAANAKKDEIIAAIEAKLAEAGDSDEDETNDSSPEGEG